MGVFRPRVLGAALWEAVERGDHGAVLALHQKLLPIWNGITGDNLPANVKSAMELQHRRAGEVRAPMPGPSGAQGRAIRDALRGAGLMC